MNPFRSVDVFGRPNNKCKRKFDIFMHTDILILLGTLSIEYTFVSAEGDHSS